MTDKIPLPRLLLVRALAVRDAFNVPVRIHFRDQARWPVAVVEERESIRQAGVSVLTPSGDNASRLRHSRALNKLERDGLIIRTRTGSRAHRVKLTPKGEFLASGWTAAYSLADPAPWVMLELLATMVDAGAGNAGCVNERHFLDFDEPKLTSKLAARFENHFLPLAAAGFADSHYDTEGRVGYSVTAAGRRALANRPPVEQLGDYNEDLANHYSAVFHATLDNRTTLKPDPRSILIPLSAGLWPAFTLEASK